MPACACVPMQCGNDLVLSALPHTRSHAASNGHDAQNGIALHPAADPHIEPADAYSLLHDEGEP